MIHNLILHNHFKNLRQGRQDTKRSIVLCQLSGVISGIFKSFTKRDNFSVFHDSIFAKALGCTDQIFPKVC